MKDTKKIVFVGMIAVVSANQAAAIERDSKSGSPDPKSGPVSGAPLSGDGKPTGPKLPIGIQPTDPGSGIDPYAEGPKGGAGDVGKGDADGDDGV